MAKSLSVYKNSSKKEYSLTDEQRDAYRQTSQNSRDAKANALLGLVPSVHKINSPRLDPCQLMPQLESNHLRCISLFSGGGGLDLGFDRAGYKHVASYELIPVCKDTLALNRPSWRIFGGPDEGDVTNVEWSGYKEEVDIVHGGPPCQPFSIAGEQKGEEDERNMWGEFIRSVNTIKPLAFIAENVLGLLNPKFESFVRLYILDELKDYSIVRFEMNSADFGVPQIRRRVFFVGFRSKRAFARFEIPTATHYWGHLAAKKDRVSLPLFSGGTLKTSGVRDALGLEDIGYDSLAPTIRSGFTGKRNTTSILNSSAGQKSWGDMGIWPNGVQSNRQKASCFPAENQNFRLAVQDVAILQGFPESWVFSGAVYQVLGQIGNSVSPPVAYHVAKNVAKALNH